MEQPRPDQSHPEPKFRVRIDSAVGSGERIRLKVETGTCEVHAFDGPAPLPLAAEDPWFSGEAVNSTFALRLAWTTLPSLVPIRRCIRSTASVPDGGSPAPTGSNQAGRLRRSRHSAIDGSIQAALHNSTFSRLKQSVSASRPSALPTATLHDRTDESFAAVIHLVVGVIVER